MKNNNCMNIAKLTKDIINDIQEMELADGIEGANDIARKHIQQYAVDEMLDVVDVWDAVWRDVLMILQDEMSILASLVDNDEKYYVTMYEEYPIFEPAEGGYYYAGCEGKVLGVFNQRIDALHEAVRLAESRDIDVIRDEDNDPCYCEFGAKIDRYGSSRIAWKCGTCIGEDKYIDVETDATKLHNESGYHPYC